MVDQLSELHAQIQRSCHGAAGVTGAAVGEDTLRPRPNVMLLGALGGTFDSSGTVGDAIAKKALMPGECLEMCSQSLHVR